MFPEKEITPRLSPKVEEYNKHLTISYSLLNRLEPEHLPWSKEVHLVEHIYRVKKRYTAVVIVLNKRILSEKDLSVKS
jgi:hypothetical protein